MEYNRLGKTGLKVSKICLGCMSYGDPTWREWVLDETQSLPFIKRALDLGINFFDTADVYSLGKSEEILGRALKEYANREDVVIASKVNFPSRPNPTVNGKGLSRKHIMEAVDASLKRLGTNYLDLYQIHRWDNETPIEETMEALHDLVKLGKVHYIGASSMFTWQFAKANHVAKLRGFTEFVSMQNHYNLIYREEEREMIPYCQSEGIGLIPWSPLARGFLTGSRQRLDDKIVSASVRQKSDPFAAMYGKPDTINSDFNIIDRVSELANKRGVSMAQISLAWMLNQPYISSPIIGATKMSHLEEAVKAVAIKLTAEEMKFLEEEYKPHAVMWS